MAEPLKNFFDARVVSRLAAEVSAVHPEFPRAAFARAAGRGLADLELLDRARQISRALGDALPEHYPDALQILLASLGPKLSRVEGNAMAPFFYLPHVIFVAERGLEHFEPSMQAQHALTQRFTAEFSIRPFLERHLERTLARLSRWTRDESEHVRRLVSEGTRPKLPWAPRLRSFELDPSPIFPLLEALKDDPSSYVRRSVANNLNDIAKDHPARALEVAARWAKGASPERLALLRHALRTLVKKGDPDALRVLGFRGGDELDVRSELTPKRVRIGGVVGVSLEVENRSRRRQAAVVDLAVFFVKASGATRPKVFKLREVVLGPGERVRLAKSISFRVHTTRRPHPGVHRFEARINGRPVPMGEVLVVT